MKKILGGLSVFNFFLCGLCMCEHQLSLLPYGSQISNSCLQGWQPGPLPPELTCQSETILVGPRYGKNLPYSSCFLLNHFSNHNNSASLEALWLGGRGEGAGLSPAECVQHLTSREQGSWLFCLLSNVHDCFFTCWAVQHFPLH